MKPYKLRIFVRAAMARMEAEQATIDEVLEDYMKLTVEEKAEIKTAVLKKLDQ